MMRRDSTAVCRVSRNFRFVVTGLAAVGLIVAGVVWWLGPNLLHLALLNSQRTEPFTVLSFVRGLQDDVYAARYQHPFAALVASEGGVLLDDYRRKAAGRCSSPCSSCPLARGHLRPAFGWHGLYFPGEGWTRAGKGGGEEYSNG